MILDAAVSRASLTTRTSGTLNRNYSSITVPSAGGFQLKEQSEREALAHALSAASRTTAAAAGGAADGSSSGSRSKHTSSRPAAAASSATPAYLHTRSGVTPLSAARGSASQQQAMLDAVLGKPGGSSYSSGSGSAAAAAAGARGLTPAAARLAKKLKQSVGASPFGGALNGNTSSRRKERSANWTPMASPSPIVTAGKQMSATSKGKQKASKKKAAATGGLTDGLLKL
jgi:hypothetical protein